jgi:hypothetical protein
MQVDHDQQLPPAKALSQLLPQPLLDRLAKQPLHRAACNGLACISNQDVGLNCLSSKIGFDLQPKDLKVKV